MPDQLTEIHVSVARIEEGIGNLTRTVENLNTVTVKRLDSHASDIDSLNLSRSRFKGISAGLGTIGTFIAGAFAWLDW
jgi:hypothetical protein